MAAGSLRAAWLRAGSVTTEARVKRGCMGRSLQTEKTEETEVCCCVVPANPVPRLCDAGGARDGQTTLAQCQYRSCRVPLAYGCG